MRTVIINRFSENTINYQEALSGLDREFFFVTREKHKDVFSDLFSRRIVFENFDDYEKINFYLKELHKEHPIQTIVATHEYDIDKIGEMRDLLGISGQSEYSAKHFRNKVLMKNMIQGAVKTPYYSEIKESKDIISFKEKYGFPFIIKPVEGAGSVGFSVISNVSELENILKEYTQFPYIAEEFIEGDMFHIDGLYFDNHLILSRPSIYLNGCLAYREEKYLGSVMLPDTHPLYERLNESVLKVLHKLPTPSHVIPFHAEFFYTPNDELVFCEIASRVGGGRINETLLLKTGINILSEFVRAQCDLDYNYQNLEIKHDSMTYGWVLIPPKKGKLVSINTDFPFDWIVDCSIKKEKIGKTFFGGDNSVSEIMNFIIKGSDEKQVHERINIISEWLKENIVWDLDALADKRTDNI